MTDITARMRLSDGHPAMRVRLLAGTMGVRRA